MTQINYTADQLRQIGDLRAYLETQGVDPQIYTAYLDGKRSLDPAILQDPAFQAYWKLTYLQLMEVLDPMLVQSLQAEVGQVDFNSLYARASGDLNEFVTNIVLDSPELMAMAAERDADPNTMSQEIIAAITHATNGASYNPNEEDPLDYTNYKARKMKEDLGFKDGFWDYLIDKDEMYISAENHLLGELADIDQQVANLSEALRSGTLSAGEVEAFKAQIGNASSRREVILGMMQGLEKNRFQLVELFSNILKSIQQLSQQLANAIRPSA